MSVIWKINGTAVSTLGYCNLALSFRNQLADEFTFDDPAAKFDDVAAFAIDAAVVLTRTEGAGSPVTWFRGVIRGTPRTAHPGESKIGYRALGAWHWLERTPCVQQIKVATDPSTIGSTLATALSGRVILGQSLSGTPQPLGLFLNAMIDFAIANGAPIARDDLSDTMTGPLIFDQVRDLSIAEVISRALQLVPDAVVWVDYAPTTPKIYIRRRDALDILELNIMPPNDSSLFGSAVRGALEIREQPDLQKSGVVLIYLSTNRANEASWLTQDVDKYPSGCATLDTHGNLTAFTDLPNTLVRTIELAGVDESITTLQQPVTVDPIPSALVFSGAITSGSDFATLSSWWKKHAPELLKANVTIKAFLDGSRTLTDGSAIVSGRNNELVKGAITDWMESQQGILTDSQVVTCGIDYEVADPLPSGSAQIQRVVKQLHVNIIATNAVTKTYSVLSSSSYTPPEPVPTGLAQILYDAISPLPRSGTWLLTEAEPTVPNLVGWALLITPNTITGGADMFAPIQRHEINLDRGETKLTFGTPAHLGPDDLIEIYRTNRTRQTVTSWNTRLTGQTGSPNTKQSLTIHHPKTTVAHGERTNPRIFVKALSVAGIVPTSTEVATALAASWATNDHPIAGDVVVLTVGGTAKLRYLLSLTSASTDGLKIVSFTVSSITYYGFMVQSGIY